MKTLFAIVLISMSGVVTAAGGDKASDSEMNQERARLGSLRQALDAKLATSEANCYQQFAVNQCLAAVRSKYREESGDLHIQEVALNDRKRRDKAMAQQSRIDERQAKKQKKDSEASASENTASAPVAPKDDHVAREQEKAKLRRNAQQSRERSHAAELSSQSEKAADAPENRTVYEDKIKKAEQHRLQRERRNREAKKPSAPSLPTPAASGASAPAR